MSPFVRDPRPVISSGLAVVFASRAVDAARAEVARELGVSASDLSALSALEAHTPITSASLAHLLGVRPSALTPVTTRLVGRGLVSRVPGVEDRRTWLLSLTGSGASLVHRAIELLEPRLEGVFAGLDASQRNQLVALLNCVVTPWLAACTAVSGKQAASTR